MLAEHGVELAVAGKLTEVDETFGGEDCVKCHRSVALGQVEPVPRLGLSLRRVYPQHPVVENPEDVEGRSSGQVVVLVAGHQGHEAGQVVVAVAGKRARFAHGPESRSSSALEVKSARPIRSVTRLPCLPTSRSPTWLPAVALRHQPCATTRISA